MPPEVAGPAPQGDRPGSQAAAKPLDASIISPDSDTVPQHLRSHLIPADPLDALARHIDGTFVLVVKVTGGKYRRRCFLTAAAAERAARRALDAGHTTYIYLAELKPLWRLTGGAS
jgi:hypothetical protein